MECDANHSPPIVRRPKLAEWMFVRQLRAGALGAALGISGEAVRKYCLPFDDGRRQIPHASIIEKIVAFTGGEVRPADFYPPHLNSAEPGSAEPVEARP